MKMWHRLCVLILSIFIVFGFKIANAQNKYFAFGLGYNFRGNSYFRGEVLNYNSTGSTSYGNKKSLNISFGQGFNFGAGFGYLFTKNMGAELAVDYLEGSRILTDKNINTYVSGVDKSSFEIQTRSLRFIPSVKMMAEMGKLSPYTRFGFIISLINNVREYSFKESTLGTNTTTTVTEWNLTGMMSVGFCGSAGIAYKIKDHMQLFAECNLLSQSFTPKKEVMNKYEINGTDQLGSLNIIDKETDFEKEYSFNNGIMPDFNAPRKVLAVSAPYSSIGFNIGMQIFF
ncbi:MAG: outer membrane beta-barrel protein [Bacteroidota bacterium]|nr:outer membrane beta-barrel protein [Bacteroidota bacterium]